MFSVTDINYNYKESQAIGPISLKHKYCRRSSFKNTVEFTTRHEAIHEGDDSLYYIFFTFR